MKRKILSISNKNIAMFIVAKIFGHRQRRVSHAESRARRLVHLPENHHHVRQHAGFLHGVIEFLAFAASFADAAEDADPLLLADHVVNHLGQQDCLADARPAEQSRFAAAFERHENVDEFDARLEDVRIWWSDAPAAAARDGPSANRRRSSAAPAIDSVSEHIEHARENCGANRRFQRSRPCSPRAFRVRGPAWGSAR